MNSVFSCTPCGLESNCSSSVASVACRVCKQLMTRGGLRVATTKAEKKQIGDRWAVCHACPHHGLHQRESGCFEGCGLLRRPCRVDALRLQKDWTGPNGRQCWLPIAPPNEFGSGVGFLAVVYNKIGGTEVWHQTLLPRLPDVAGFVCLEAAHATGDMKRLGCPTGVGLAAARRLASTCHTLVAWGVGDKLGQVLTTAPRPRVISVGHGDGTSAWSGPMLASQQPWTDQYVYLCHSGIETVPPAMRDTAVMIPNAPDPLRVQASRPRAAIRRELGIPDGHKMIVAFSRISPEKGIERLMLAGKLLPENYHLLIAGSTVSWNDWHGQALRALADDRVRIIDPVDCPGDLLAAADAYVSASEQEGYGLSTAEAMLAGVPVIATPTGFLENDRELARLVHHGATPAEWAEAIVADVANAHWRAKRVAMARHAMQTEHSVDRFASAWRDLVR